MEPVHAGHSQPLRLWWPWLTVPFDSDSLCQSVLFTSAGLHLLLLIRAVGKHSDEMQKFIFNIHCVLLSLQSNNEWKLCLLFPANYWSLKDFRDTTFTYQSTAMRKEERGRKGEERNNPLWTHWDAYLIASSIDACPVVSWGCWFEPGYWLSCCLLCCTKPILWAPRRTDQSEEKRILTR